MRVRSAILVFALVLVFGSLALVSQAQAAGSWSTDENGQPVYLWTADDWVSNGQPAQCEFILDLAFSGVPGGTSYFKLYGEKENDPLVTQTVTNTSGATWQDWHVDILNGAISRTVDAPVVHKVGADSSNWSIQYVQNPGYTDGFGAVWVGGTSSVATSEKLSIKFRWTPTGGPVTIRQYPTDTGSPIPEPSTILALASCLLPMGIGAFRRRSK